MPDNPHFTLHKMCIDDDDFFIASYLSNLSKKEREVKLLYPEPNTGRIPLHHAAINGSRDIIEMLLRTCVIEQIMKKDNNGMTPCDLAEKFKHTHLLTRLGKHVQKK